MEDEPVKIYVLELTGKYDPINDKVRVRNMKKELGYSSADQRVNVPEKGYEVEDVRLSPTGRIQVVMTHKGRDSSQKYLDCNWNDDSVGLDSKVVKKHTGLDMVEQDRMPCEVALMIRTTED